MDIQILESKFCDYSHYIRGHSKHTLSRYKTVFKLFRECEEVQEIEEVSKEKVLLFFYNGRIKRDWKPATFISYRNTLSVFF